MRDAIMTILRALIIIQMDIRPRFGLHCQADSPWIEHVARGAPQREVCPGREPVVDRTCPTSGPSHLVPSNGSLHFSSEFYSLSLSRESLAWSQPPFVTSGVSASWCVPTQSLIAFVFTRTWEFEQRRDSGWIHTLLEEAENERMHLMFVAKFLA